MTDPTQEELDRFVEQILKHKPKKDKGTEETEENERNGKNGKG
jgi:hypothetical protein